MMKCLKFLFALAILSDQVGVASADDENVSFLLSNSTAPLMRIQEESTNQVSVFRVISNVAGAVPSDPSILWEGELLLARATKGTERRQSFCVFEVVTHNGDQVVLVEGDEECIGAINETDGSSGLRVLDGGRYSVFSSFQPSFDLVRKRVTVME